MRPIYRKTIVCMSVIAALGFLGACSDGFTPNTPVASPHAHPGVPIGEPMTPPVQAQPAPQPQQQQADSGPGWGGALAAGALGYMLGSSNSSPPQRVVEQRTVYVERPAQPAPTPPKPASSWWGKRDTPPAAAPTPSAAPKPSAPPAAAPAPRPASPFASQRSSASRSTSSGLGSSRSSSRR